MYLKNRGTFKKSISERMSNERIIKNYSISRCRSVICVCVNDGMTSTITDPFNFSTYISLTLNRHLDIDECMRSTDGCSHGCKNTIGSYQCTCPYGLKIGLDKHRCRGESSFL